MPNGTHGTGDYDYGTARENKERIEALEREFKKVVELQLEDLEHTRRTLARILQLLKQLTGRQ